MAKVRSNDGTVIAYDKKGQGPNLIIVLGALNKRGSGKRLAKLLEDHFTVITYDRRGRGDSTDNLPYSTDKEVEDIDALVGELGGQAYLYGHSSGAILALLAAKKLADKVKGIALYEVPYDSDTAAQKTSEKYKKELKLLMAEGKNGGAVSLFVKSVGVTDKQIAAMKRLPMWKGLTSMAHTLEYDTIELMELYPDIDAQAVRTPALVMYGSDSPAFMGRTAKELSKKMRNAQLKKLEGQWHDVKPDALAPVLSEFFSKKTG